MQRTLYTADSENGKHTGRRRERERGGERGGHAELWDVCQTVSERINWLNHLAFFSFNRRALPMCDFRVNHVF